MLAGLRRISRRIHIPVHRQFAMSKREQQLEAECEELRGELRAMEELVQRYQDELTAARSASCFRHNCRNAPDLHRVEEELFENQNLAPRGSAMRVSRAELPVLCRANGEEARFSEVELPSPNWEWVSDWRHDIHAHTDESGWLYADSWEQLRDTSQLHCSEQTMRARVRQRRWKRERMLVRSTGLPAALNESLLTRSRLAAMRFANEKLTQQLLRERQRIEELEKRDKIYEAHMLKLQQVAEELSNDLYARSFDLHDPVAVPYTVSKSTEVLKQTEALLGDMLTEQGVARLDTLAVTSEVQRRRSEILAACENELQNTMDEFNDLARTLERRQSPPPSSPEQPAPFS
ncbi:Chromosome transmission fidelity protein 18 [Phytophthora pseudosyringae]|uniref:Chromosome transmission fidelity protein 18 n=1 Tax=Phytophthora pseudosyringae TaxID=221518 RepID=A0A8T1WH43_9STRA|nr:Chromosome transmission fidelity protein 18 [Phytophthora pseudosyringae]